MDTMRKIRTLPVLAILGALTCWSSMVSADPIKVDFEITGFEKNATISGWFTGDDSIGFFPGILGIAEVTAFELIWSGNSITPGFTHGIADLTSLIYNIGSNSLDLLTSNSGGAFFSTPSASLFGPIAVVNGSQSPSCFWRFCGRDPDKQIEIRPGVTTTVKVPEPATLTLFGIGLIAIGFAGRRRRA